MRYGWLLIVLLLCCGAGTAHAVSAFHPDRDELMQYDISFLWFKRFGAGSLYFTPMDKPGHYRAVVRARTLGVAAWLSRHQERTYEVEMVRDDEGWLLPLKTRSVSIKGPKDDRRQRLSEYVFDYAAHKVHYQKYHEGKPFGEEKVLEMPPGQRVFDLLTAFYNWRLGKFGTLKEGTEYRLPAFTKKGLSDIQVLVRSRKDHRQHDEFPADGLLCLVRADEEVFGTGAGELNVWINDRTEPGLVQVKDVLGLGDVWARLRSH